jgi:predicted phage terminase large subunit-like protein
MRKTALGTLERLETEERAGQEAHRSSLIATAFLCWKVVFAHYLGDLKPDDEDPDDAWARVLGYDSQYEYVKALFEGEITEIKKRFKDACRRLFGQLGLEKDHSAPGASYEAIAGLVDKLPEQWLQWIESNSPVSRNSRVFTQIGKAALRLVRIPEHLLLPHLKGQEAKVCFWAFRRYTRPGMKVSWWQYEVANEFQRFYHCLKKGKRPKLALMAPPQHGKTVQVTDFIAWVAGKEPDLKTIFASYSEELGADVNKQHIMSSERYVSIFGVRLGDGRSRWVRNSNTLEYPYYGGSFYNTTVGGQITGKGLDLGLVDDPVKGRAEATSKTVRDKLWQWFTDDFLTRFSDPAGLVMIMTRWHLDDPIGRLIQRFPDVKIFRYSAIAEEDERNRSKGEALFPEHKSLSFLLERKKAMTQASWESEYQQNPIVVGGGIFPIEKLKQAQIAPGKDDIAKACRYWDKGGTEGGGAYTAGVLMLKLRNGSYVIEHVVRGQWSALEREEKIKFWAKHDSVKFNPGAYEIGVEQEPGSSGKESAEATIRNLAGYKVFADKVTGSKELRAEPFATQVQCGNVHLIAGLWQTDLLDEMESFPSGKYRDQVDACSGAFNRLALGSTYDLFNGAFDY